MTKYEIAAGLCGIAWGMAILETSIMWKIILILIGIGIVYAAKWV